MCTITTERVKLKPNDKYPHLTLVVPFPESQLICQYEGFKENAILINSITGLDRYGCAAYRVNPKWWNDVKCNKVRKLTKEEIDSILEEECDEDLDFLDDDDD